MGYEESEVKCFKILPFNNPFPFYLPISVSVLSVSISIYHMYMSVYTFAISNLKGRFLGQ
jgi:hypothetical protein